MQLTLKQSPDSNGQSSGRFSLFIIGSRSVSVTCTANRRAAVQSLCENPSAEFGMEVTIISTTLVITGSFVMLLALCLILMRRKKPRKKPVPPLFYLEKLSRRQRDSKINDYGSLPRNRSEEQDIGGQTGPTSDPVGGDVPGGRSSPNGGYEDIRLFVRNQLPQAQPTGSTMSGELSEGPSRANQVEHDGNTGSGHSDESNAEQNANEYGECLHAEPRAESRDEVLSHSNLNASPVDDPCYDSDHN